jgi:hypothetical protein
MKRAVRSILPIAVVAFILLAGWTILPLAAEGAKDPLAFMPGLFDWETTVVDGKPVEYFAYKKIPYVTNVADPAWQYLNVYIPISLQKDQAAPIFFPNQIGGYMPNTPILPAAKASMAIEKDKANAVSVALSLGYVVVSPGARGSSSQVGTVYTGKAPAAIVDLKAAVRYLRYNDAIMAGSAEKIICDGTSAGGALSALLGASGNDPLYEPYLTALGAAKARDDIYAAVCFCPITDLENSDPAYEWLYNRLNDDTAAGKSLYGFTPAQKALSTELKVRYPAYLESLNLKSVYDQTPLTSENYEAYIKTFVVAAANKAEAKGIDISGKNWLIRKDGKVVDINFDLYLSQVGRMKMIKDPPAFDWLGDTTSTPPRPSSRENNLFGTATQNASIFTDYAAAKAGTTVPKEVKDRVYLMNAMNFVGKKGSTSAPYWYIRHGTLDRDTAFTVPVALYTRLMNTATAKEVDFAFGWDRPHSGDYDMAEMFAWMAKVSK